MTCGHRYIRDEFDPGAGGSGVGDSRRVRQIALSSGLVSLFFLAGERTLAASDVGGVILETDAVGPMRWLPLLRDQGSSG